MIAEQALVARLEDQVGGLVGQRIYPMQAPQLALMPAITYQRISTARVQDFTGSTGLADPRIQVDVWADTYPSAKTVADAVRQALDGYQTADLFVLILGEHDLISADGRRYRVSQDYSCWHEED